VFDQALQQFDKVVCVFSAKHLQHILILVIDLLSDLHHAFLAKGGWQHIYPPADCSISLYVQRAFEMIGNTAPFNGGLPAMSVPCGLSEGLPIGMMLFGANYAEMKIYQAAYAFEQSGDWREM
jgi:hypothetical protein